MVLDGDPRRREHPEGGTERGPEKNVLPTRERESIQCWRGQDQQGRAVALSLSVKTCGGLTALTCAASSILPFGGRSKRATLCAETGLSRSSNSGFLIYDLGFDVGSSLTFRFNLVKGSGHGSQLLTGFSHDGKILVADVNPRAAPMLERITPCFGLSVALALDFFGSWEWSVLTRWADVLHILSSSRSIGGARALIQGAPPSRLKPVAQTIALK